MFNFREFRFATNVCKKKSEHDKFLHVLFWDFPSVLIFKTDEKVYQDLVYFLN